MLAMRRLLLVSCIVFILACATSALDLRKSNSKAKVAPSVKAKKEPKEELIKWQTLKPVSTLPGPVLFIYSDIQCLAAQFQGNFYDRWYAGSNKRWSSSAFCQDIVDRYEKVGISQATLTAAKLGFVTEVTDDDEIVLDGMHTILWELKKDAHGNALKGQGHYILMFRHQESKADTRFAMYKYSAEGVKVMGKKGGKTWVPEWMSSVGAGIARIAMNNDEYSRTPKYHYHALEFWKKVITPLLGADPAKGKISPAIYLGGYSLGGTIAQYLALQEECTNPEPTAAVAFAGNGPITNKLYGNNTFDRYIVNFVDVQPDEDASRRDLVPMIGCVGLHELVCLHAPPKTNGLFWHEDVAYGRWPAALKDAVDASMSTVKLSAQSIEDGVVGCVIGDLWNRLCGTCRASPLHEFDDDDYTDERDKLLALKGVLCPNIKY